MPPATVIVRGLASVYVGRDGVSQLLRPSGRPITLDMARANSIGGGGASTAATNQYGAATYAPRCFTDLPGAHGDS